MPPLGPLDCPAVCIYVGNCRKCWHVTELNNGSSLKYVLRPRNWRRITSQNVLWIYISNFNATKFINITLLGIIKEAMKIYVIKYEFHRRNALKLVTYYHTHQLYTAQFCQSFIKNFLRKIIIIAGYKKTKNSTNTWWIFLSFSISDHFVLSLLNCCRQIVFIMHFPVVV